MDKKNALCLLTAVLVAGACDVASARENRARDDRDSGNREEHDLAREALGRGDVLPITRILALAAQRVPGEVVEVKLETRRTPLLYELKILTPSGVVREVHIDARNGVIVKEEDD